MSSFQGAPPPRPAVLPAVASEMGGGARLEVGGRWGQRAHRRSLSSHSPVLLATKKGETLPHLPYHPQVPSGPKKVTEPGGAPKDAPCIFDFLLPVAQKHDESAIGTNI